MIQIMQDQDGKYIVIIPNHMTLNAKQTAQALSEANTCRCGACFPCQVKRAVEEFERPN